MERIIKTIRRVLATVSAGIVFASMFMPAHAMSFERSKDKTKYRFDEEKGNTVYSGGLNEYKGIEANSREETLRMEEQVKNDGYVLVSTDHKQISDEDFSTLKKQGFWFSWRYLNKDDAFRWSMDKVYVYKKSLDDMLEQSKDGGLVEDYTSFEIECSTVVLSYDYWYSWEKQGSISDEFNDNLAEWEDAGYLLIKSPINVEIILLNIDQKTYYRFYISANTPFYVALPCSTYFVEMINGYGIEDFETNLPSKNTIVLNKDRNGTKETAYEVDITKTVEKYRIPEIDIGGKPDYSIDKNQNIPKEATVVDEEKPAEKKKPSIVKIIFASLLIAFAAFIMILVYKFTKKNDNQY